MVAMRSCRWFRQRSRLDLAGGARWILRAGRPDGQARTPMQPGKGDYGWIQMNDAGTSGNPRLRFYELQFKDAATIPSPQCQARNLKMLFKTCCCRCDLFMRIPYLTCTCHESRKVRCSWPKRQLSVRRGTATLMLI